VVIVGDQARFGDQLTRKGWNVEIPGSSSTE
jgi:hypothetical protein